MSKLIHDTETGKPLLMFSTADVGEFLSVDTYTVMRWCKDCGLKHRRSSQKAKANYYITWRDLCDWMRINYGRFLSDHYSPLCKEKVKCMMSDIDSYELLLTRRAEHRRDASLRMRRKGVA